MNYKLPSTKITEAEFWACDRCKINSQGKQMCPCPRGSCEAEQVGTVTTTVVVTIKSSIDDLTNM